MDRRSLIKSLGIFPVGLIAGKVVSSKESTEVTANEISSSLNEYKEFRYYWTGWKANWDNSRLYGQWIAVNKEGIRIYSSYPGKSGVYCAGEHFDLTCLHDEGQEILELDADPNTKEKAKKYAKSVLFVEISKFLAPENKLSKSRASRFASKDKISNKLFGKN